MGPTVLHLRSETKPLEHRSLLSPTGVKALVEGGYKVNVERSTIRCFEDRDFESAGAVLIPEGSWPDAPADHIILGLKELPEDDFPLKHNHIYFGHCFKDQPGWEKVLSRFKVGGGVLLDLEFLLDESGKPLAPSGYYAGFAGAALALKAWGHQIVHQDGPPLPSASPYQSNERLINDVAASVSDGAGEIGRLPRVIVIGARGHCGKGAVDFCLNAGIPTSNIIQWNRSETERGGPFAEVIESDILINCIYLEKRISPFLDFPSLESSSRKLSVISDVSCDIGDTKNPIPVYSNHTTFDKPTMYIPVSHGSPVSVISIDHLPSLLPRQASEACSRIILPCLLRLTERKTTEVWQYVDHLFEEKVAALPEVCGR